MFEFKLPVHGHFNIYFILTSNGFYLFPFFFPFLCSLNQFPFLSFNFFSSWIFFYSYFQRLSFLSFFLPLISTFFFPFSFLLFPVIILFRLPKVSVSFFISFFHWYSSSFSFIFSFFFLLPVNYYSDFEWFSFRPPLFSFIHSIFFLFLSFFIFL